MEFVLVVVVVVVVVLVVVVVVVVLVSDIQFDSFEFIHSCLSWSKCVSDLHANSIHLP
jgi:hypothetical protein